MVPKLAKKNSKRAVNRRASQNKSPGEKGRKYEIMRTPVYRPVYKFTRTFEGGVDVACDGINPSLYGFTFQLSNLPNSTDFTNLFDLFRITHIEVEWTPEYTELTDAAPISNAVNIRFNSCVDISDGSAPSNVQAVLQYGNLHATGITKVHKIKFVPAILMDALIPCMCWVPTSAPTTKHYAVKVAVEPTGVAMTFRSKVKFWLECANVN